LNKVPAIKLSQPADAASTIELKLDRRPLGAAGLWRRDAINSYEHIHGIDPTAGAYADTDQTQSVPGLATNIKHYALMNLDVTGDDTYSLDTRDADSCHTARADQNQDGRINGDDIQSFVIAMAEP